MKEPTSRRIAFNDFVAMSLIKALNDDIDRLIQNVPLSFHVIHKKVFYHHC
jgi:hypothetical protein